MMARSLLNLPGDTNRDGTQTASTAPARATARAQRDVRPHVMHIVTASATTGLMRRQLGFLREAGFKVTVVASPGESIDRIAAEERVAKATVPMEREISLLRDLHSLWLLWRLIRRERPTLVNVGTAKAGLLAGLVARLCRVPCRVYTLHGLRLETLAGWKRALLTGTERIACRCAHRVLCVSESVQRRAAELDLCRAPRSLFLGAGSFNGVDTQHFAPTPEKKTSAAALRRELGLSPDTPVIGFVGRFVRDKGISELVEAYQLVRRQFPETRLLLMGNWESGDPVPEEARAFIETDPGVIFTGHVADPSAHYQVMDLLALPTYREGFPTVALEASASAKPIVATYATGAVDAVVDGTTGLLVEIGHAKQLADAFIKLIEQPELAQRMGAAGRERVLKHFTTERVCRALAQFYESLLVENGAAMAGIWEAVRRPWFQRAAKRVCDLLGAVLLLAATGPLMALTALALWAKMGSPVLFRQRRAGRHGKPFTLLKFRTMTQARGEQGLLLPDADRRHLLGDVLRRFSIDELPQIWNIVKGEMSLVGPRPLLVEYLPAYTAREQLRHAVRPGLTGYAQIRGRQTLLFSSRLELDAWYVEHWSLGLDFRVFVRTVPKLLSGGDTTTCQDVATVDDRGFWRYLRHVPAENIGRGNS
ncbi:MAG: sugar transferase [Armatimonadetes bacterium]|nr:sugar transferase [Armatimonadota bacterium]